MTNKEKDLADRLYKYFNKNPPSNECLLEIIKVVFQYGNVMSVKNYANAIGITPQGVYVFRNVQKINGIRFVIDNDI